LGLIGYYRKFVRSYKTICKTLNKLLKKDAFSWGQDATSAFESLKEVMVNPPTLSLPDLNKPFIIEIDTLDYGIDAMLI